jgi:hypothetical protein
MTSERGPPASTIDSGCQHADVLTSHYFKEENMTEVFRKYPETTPSETEERKGSPVCVVSHPDAGGPCERPAIGEVWSLPFCELHGREAELAARDEMASSLEGIFTGLQALEQERHDRNETAVRIIEEAISEAGITSDTAAHEEAMALAYPPEELEANTHPATLTYDYEDHGRDSPHDWWCEAQLMACRSMRQAHDRGLSGLLEELELARERATVQRLLAARYMDLRYEHARI